MAEPGQPLPQRRLKRVLLACAGANPAILAACPTEVEKYVGLGSAVLISAALAAISGTVAFATAAGGGDDLGAWLAFCAPIGIVYGAVVFAIDRFLVSSSLNPVTRLADADDASRWAGPLRRVGEVVRTLGSAAPRLVLATLIGLLVAEPLLLVVFRNEIDQRVSQMQAAQLDEAAERIDTRYDDELERVETRELELAAADQPLADAVAELAGLDDDIEVAETELAELQLLLRNEIAGVAVGDTGDQTTGRSGDGPVADELRAEIELQQTRLGGLDTRRASQQQRVDELGSGQEDRSESIASELIALADQRQQLGVQRQGDLDQVAARTAAADGLLMRIEALEWLTRQQLTPSGSDPADPGTGTGAAGAGLTTVGLAVWLVRLWVLILDAIPIGFKVLLSLRSQRPYDALLAAHQAAEMDLARSMVTGQHRPITGPVPTVRVPVGATNGGGRHTGARYLAPSGTSLGRFAPPNAPDADN